MTVGRAAYDAHDPSRRLSLRYEDLLDHTDKHVRAIYEWLGLTTDDVGRVVQRRSFDALPPEARGPGLVNRAASPGLWRQNLNADEQAIVNRVMRDQLLRAGYSVD
jgi:hypothetical protein